MTQNDANHEIDFDAFISDLNSGVVTFTYQKINGETREARGTLVQNLLPTHHRTKSSSRKKNPNIICYYDLNSQGWRSFRKDLLESWDHELHETGQG